MVSESMLEQFTFHALDGGIVDHRSPQGIKIALFRALFRGRDDVYPRRFESRRTGRSGYQPACANEWVRGICEKPRIKCSECPHQRFLPVTDEVIRWHLSGHDGAGADFVMGMLSQNSTEFGRNLRPLQLTRQWFRALCLAKVSFLRRATSSSAIY